MKKPFILLMAVFLFSSLSVYAQDWPNLKKYEKANTEIDSNNPDGITAVFMGNSITEGWASQDPEFLKDNNYVGRGISGQTTPQMLLRFRPDVIDLAPKVVVILAGTNDIAGNTGPMTVPQIAGNIFSMAELAKAHGIKVVISSVMPVAKYPWSPEVESVKPIKELNAMLKEYADKNNIVYLDYFPALSNDQRGMKKEYSKDGVHPTMEGYKTMEPLVVDAVNKALK